MTETWLLRGTQEMQSGCSVAFKAGSGGTGAAARCLATSGRLELGTRELWKVFELGKAMVSCVFGKISPASILEGIKLGAANPGE